MPLILILIVAAVLVGYVVSIYNFFVSSKARIKASIQEIGNQLKRQFDLIPNLEETAKGYLKHEKGIFEKLADARKSVASALKSGDLNQMAEASEKIGSLLPSIKVAVESNPDIKGAEVMVSLMDELRDTSDKVMYARRTLIDLTADFNVKRASFPSNIIATMFGFEEQKGLVTPTEGEHLELGSEETKSHKVKF